MAGCRAVLIGIVLLLFCCLAVPFAWLGRRPTGFAPGWPMVLCCRVLLGLLRIRVVREGGPGVGARLVVANHVSWADILVLGSLEPLCFLAKREIGTWPLIATLSRVQGTVYVDRERRRTIPAVNRTMADRLGQGRSVLLFPEGTTHDGTRRGRFLTAHLGCLRDRLTAPPGLGACAVQAVGLAYSDPAAAWVGDATLVPHLWAVLRRPPMTCTVSYGRNRAVIPGHDRKALGRVLALEIEALLEAVPATQAEEGQAITGAEPALGH